MTQTTTQQPQQPPADGGQVRQQHPLDEAMEVLEEVVAGVLSAVGVIVWNGLSLAAQAWVNDRPRRQVKRTRRRRRWRRSKGWRRNLLYAEYGVVLGWLITRSVIRMPRSTWKVARPAAAQGWATGVAQARAHRAARQGTPIPPDPAGAAPDPTQPQPADPSRLWDGEPETDADRRWRQRSRSQPTDPGPTGWSDEQTIHAECLDYVAEAMGRTCPRCGTPWQPVTFRFGWTETPTRMSCPTCGAWRSAHDGDTPTASPQPSTPPVAEPQVTVTVSDLPGSGDAAAGEQSAPGKGGQEDIVDAVVLCTWLEQDGTFCKRELPEGEIFCPHHGETTRRPPTGAPSRRWDGEPETDHDRRFFAARAAAAPEVWLDPDGHPVPANERGWPIDPAPAPGVDGYEPHDSDPANAAVPHPACSGHGCADCGNGQVPAWSVDPAFGVVPATWADCLVMPPATSPPQNPGATPAPVPATASAVATTGRNHPAMSTTTVTTSSNGTGGSIATDLQHLQDLRLETDRCSIVLEQFEELGKLIRTWTTALPERVQAAPFGTKNINTAVNGVAEHGAKSGALREQLTVLRQAIGQAMGLGDHIGSLQAEGKTGSYASQ